ncbi:DUF4352 domain-containing protein [Alkalicoccobacillus gibsonii]|uniref:DUF4352 domain-containing protein n=1 Tax=Alkalicoccobacillus gibsonii TaxID=79881 RepID=A0ABU9VFZ4_9BACI
MREWQKVSGVAVLSVGVLLGCNNNNEVVEEGATVENNSNDDSSSSENETSTEGFPDKEDFGSEENSTSNNHSQALYDDQDDLKIGDSGSVETTLATYQVTLDGLEIVEQMNGVEPEMEVFVVADVTIKNVGENTIDINDSLLIWDISQRDEGGSYSERSQVYDVLDPFDGELEPGEEQTGQLLYENYDSEEHFIRVREGLLSSSAVKNKVTWSFSKEETQ